MRTPHQRGIQGNHIHQHAEAESLLQQAPGDPKLRETQSGIEKQLHRVVARLAVDIDATREVRRARIIEPVVVGEPRVFTGQRHEVAGPRMIQADRRLPSLAQHPGDTGIIGKGLANLVGLTNLRCLYLRCKAINSEGLAHLSRMNFLTSLSLRVPELNQFEFLRNFTRLTDLSLDGTSIADADLANLAGLNRLRSLDLSDTQIRDGALRHLAGLSNLQKLDLAGTRITNAGLDQLTGLSRCKELNLRRTAVTPEGIVRLSARYPAMRILLD